MLERDFVLRPAAAGTLGALSVRVVAAGDTTLVAVPAVEAVGAPMAWPSTAVAPRGRREPDPVRDEGRPPSGQGRDADRERAPQGMYPGGGAYPAYPGGYPNGAYPGADPNGAYGGAPGGYPNGGTNPYVPDGWGVSPIGSDWAATAAGDPWWPELVPVLERYQTAVEDPTGIVRLEAGLTPAPVFEGQQVTLVSTATFAPEAAARFGSSPQLFPPEAGDAWSVDIPWAPPTPAAAAGRVQEAHTFMRAFFPVGPGTLSVDPVRLSLQSGPRAGVREDAPELATEPLSVEVRPIPQRDAPPGWNGAVGRYRVRAWVQPGSVGWGESALLTVEVSGAGNVRALRRPDPGAVWGAELRPTGERAVVEVRDGVVGGVKTFSWLVVPVEPGLIRIGPVIFSYFDPWMGTFGQVATDEVGLESRIGDVPGRGDTDVVGGGGRGEAPWIPRASEAPHPATATATATEMAGAGESALALTESDVARLRDRVARVPDDAEAWRALGETFAAVRPGEGWAEWAFASGLRRAPRDPALRQALWGSPAWAPLPGRGLPRIPLTAGESLGLASSLGLVGLGLGLGALRGSGGGEGRRPGRIGVAGLLLLGSFGSLEPWMVARGPSDHAVAVEGPVEMREQPTQNAEVLGRIPSGGPLSVGASYGDWVRVRVPDGGAGWVESVRVAPLG